MKRRLGRRRKKRFLGRTSRGTGKILERVENKAV